MLAAQLAGQWKRKNAPARLYETIAAISHHDDLEKEWEGKYLTEGGAPMDFTLSPSGSIKPDFSRYLSITVIAIRSAILKVLFSRCYILIKRLLLTIYLWAETLTISMFPDLTGKVSYQTTGRFDKKCSLPRTVGSSVNFNAYEPFE